MHPYTRGLMASIPRSRPASRTALVPVKGQPPNLSQLPLGCSFNPRCSEALDRCRRDMPELMKANDKHLHACWAAPHV
ncbi:oligopeptide/dipeptide ABC transporter ATP-binding protein [Bradyrhizobium sp. CB2312]|uniref:oligopeptide/dipeptide ABC transporter ATP-binding protein n=1 Tax=Bradyrhizobium sp. CB2312 TaxID=3039155 RepID=UPI0032C23015